MYQAAGVTNYLKLLRNLSKPHWFEIIELIKCSQGMAVGELAEKMGMSYMGVKKHCLAMQKLGFLDTWRRPKEVGRPEKIYRVTSKLDPLFPQISNEVSMGIVEAAAQLEPNAAEKLLFYFFRSEGENLLKVVTADSVQERAEKFAAERTRRGYYSFCHYSEEEGLYIVEHHNPLQLLFDKYETLERMEIQMFERLLGAHVARTVKISSGLVRYRFDLSPR